MALLTLVHPIHGTKIAISYQEYLDDKVNGWKILGDTSSGNVFDVNAPFSTKDSNRRALGAAILPDPSGITLFGDEISSPLDIPNCELWLDAYEGPVTASWQKCQDGQTVNTWLDNSGNGRHATIQAGSPQYRATGGLDGAPGVYIGANCRMVTSGFVPSGWGNSITVFHVRSRDPSWTSALKISLSISSVNFWQGANATNNQRDITVAGLTGFTGNGSVIPRFGGVQALGIGASEAWVQGSDIGVSGSGSNATSRVAISAGSVAFSSGAVCIGGLSGSSTYDWPGAISAVIVYSRYLNDTEKRKVMTYLQTRFESKGLVICVGNSLTSGTGSTGGSTQQLSASGTNYPARLLANIGSTARVMTDAYPGRTSKQILTESPAYSSLLVGNKNTVTVVWEGANTAGIAPYESFIEQMMLCQRYRGMGAKVVICTTLYRNDTGGNAKQAELTNQSNKLIRDNWSKFADAICDLAADARLSNPDDTIYFANDKVHLTDAGYTVVESLLRPVILSLIR